MSGKVQGVWYRAWFEERARALGLAGWVRNRADGRVEAVVAGRPDAVEEMVRLARTGSPASRVAAVEVTDDAGLEALTGFAVRPTL